MKNIRLTESEISMLLEMLNKKVNEEKGGDDITQSLVNKFIKASNK